MPLLLRVGFTSAAWTTPAGMNRLGWHPRIYVASVSISPDVMKVARLNAYLQESLLGMTVIQVFGQETAHAREFGRLNEEHRQAVFRRMGYDALLYAGVELIGSVAVAALLWWGLHLAGRA